MAVSILSRRSCSTFTCFIVRRPGEGLGLWVLSYRLTSHNTIDETLLFFIQMLQLLQEQNFPNPQQQSGFKQEPLDHSPTLPSTLATPPPEQPSPQPLIVCNTDFPGLYGFSLGFEEEKGPPTKSAQWTYSPTLEKLFVKMRCIVPIRVKLNG